MKVLSSLIIMMTFFIGCGGDSVSEEYMIQGVTYTLSSGSSVENISSDAVISVQADSSSDTTDVTLTQGAATITW